MLQRSLARRLDADQPAGSHAHGVIGAGAKRLGVGRPPPFGTRLRRVLLTLLAVAVSVVVGYVVVASWVLSRLEDWATHEDFLLSYDSARTIWPGRVEIENLRIRTSDSNVQLELLIARAKVDVSLHELLSKRFHATHVETEGTEFRLRYKLVDLDHNAARVAAYPPITGYEGPPLRAIEPPEPPADGWSFRLDDVTAHVTRLWVVEYDYRGPAVAKGAFELRPGRFLELAPATLHFQGGALAVGENFVARRLEGVLHAQIAPTDTQIIQGLGIFQSVTARMDAELEDGELDFTDMYLEQRLPFRVSGAARGSIHAGLTEGRLTADTQVEVTSSSATVSTKDVELTGDWMLRLDGVSNAESPALRVTAISKKCAASGERGPTLDDLRATVELGPTAVFAPMHRKRLALSVGSLAIPDLGWFESLASREKELELGGEAHARLDFVDDVTKGVSGELALSFDRVDVSTGDIRVEATGSARARFKNETDARLALEDFHWSVERGSLRLGDETWSPWSMELKSNSMHMLREPTAFQTTLDVKLNNTGGLASLMLPDLPATLADHLFGLDELRGRVALYSGNGLRKVEVMEAESGAVRAEGHWTSRATRSQGALLFETPVKNFGVAVDNGTSEVTLAPSTKFLSSTGLEVAGAR